MIRLWKRVGIFRVLSVMVLALGLVGGLLVARQESGDDPAATAASRAATAKAEARAKSNADIRQLAADLSGHRDAQSKADAVAAVDAERARVTEDQTRKNQAAARSQSRSTKPGVNAGPIPASCGEYSGARAVGCTLMLKKGFGLDQMPCLDKLWTKESKWNVKAKNSDTGAYGIPQAMPGGKMADFGDDWQTNPATQVAWGLKYIEDRYDTPCGAWSKFQAKGWY